MRILTDQGNINLDDIRQFELSEKALKFIELRKGASEIFFSNEIDLTDPDEEFAEEINEIGTIALIDTKYSAPARAIAVANLLGESFENIDEVSSTQFSVEGADYLVLLDDEADEQGYEMAKSLFEDIGVEGFSEGTRQHIYDNFVNTQWFDDAMHENHESYANDIRGENADSSEYLSRLHQEMVERDIFPEPDWPQESDFEDDDGNVDEDAFEEATKNYTDEMENIIESSIEDFIADMDEDYDNGLDYFRSNFGDEEIKTAVDKHGLLNAEGIIKYLIESDGRGSYLSSYDQNEESETVTFDGKTNEFYIYRLS